MKSIHSRRSYKFESAFFKSLPIASEIGEVAGTSFSFLGSCAGMDYKSPNVLRKLQILLGFLESFALVTAE
jgi:hypothetical protein